MNEYAALPTVCQNLKTGINIHGSKYEILFVDGNSVDGTKEFLLKEGFWVHSQTKSGMRQAINEGVKLLLDKNVDSITFAQPDGNCDLAMINQIIEPFENSGFELIIGSRYIPPAKSYDDDLISKFGNWYFSKIITFTSGHRYFDAMVGYRTFSSSLVEKMGLLTNEGLWFPEKFISTSLGWDPLISTLAPLYGVSITEIPISEPVRIGGEVKKQTIKWGLGYTLQVLYVLFFLRRKLRKNKLFS
jgi:glycosyltransferase involved in cell wall biosynthesis